jgi:acyl-CoA dehydrogenase
MDFTPTPEQNALTQTVAKACEPFDDDYWADHDRNAVFPDDFHQTMAECGVLGIAMPEEYGGTGLGVTEAALVMH